VSLTVCIAPRSCIGYPTGGGYLWSFLNWALGLRSIGRAAQAALPFRHRPVTRRRTRRPPPAAAVPVCPPASLRLIVTVSHVSMGGHFYGTVREDISIAHQER
jgi:hypothetical protein